MVIFFNVARALVSSTKQYLLLFFNTCNLFSFTRRLRSKLPHKFKWRISRLPLSGVRVKPRWNVERPQTQKKRTESSPRAGPRQSDDLPVRLKHHNLLFIYLRPHIRTPLHFFSVKFRSLKAVFQAGTGSLLSTCSPYVIENIQMD